MSAFESETMRQRFYRVAAQLLDEDPRVCVLLADIGVSQLRAFGIFDRHPQRAINVGIREALMVSAAAGMALEGMRPIAHSYTPFLIERAYEQIKLDFVHQGVGGILVSIGASYDAAEEGRTHQAPEDVALMTALPGWTIHVPGHPDEVEHLLCAAATRDDAVYIRLTESVNADAHLAGVTVIRHGSPGAPTILAVGPMLRPTLEAHDTPGRHAALHAYATATRRGDAPRRDHRDRCGSDRTDVGRNVSRRGCCRAVRSTDPAALDRRPQRRATPLRQARRPRSSPRPRRGRTTPTTGRLASNVR